MAKKIMSGGYFSLEPDPHHPSQPHLNGGIFGGGEIEVVGGEAAGGQFTTTFPDQCLLSFVLN
jgi:hypothetical protein